MIIIDEIGGYSWKEVRLKYHKERMLEKANRPRMDRNKWLELRHTPAKRPNKFFHVSTNYRWMDLNFAQMGTPGHVADNKFVKASRGTTYKRPKE